MEWFAQLFIQFSQLDKCIAWGRSCTVALIAMLNSQRNVLDLQKSVKCQCQFRQKCLVANFKK